MKNSICLNMIVKNESSIIENTLNNLCSYIKFTYWVISDTGSTDDTPSIIINYFKKKIFLVNYVMMTGVILVIIVH